MLLGVEQNTFVSSIVIDWRWWLHDVYMNILLKNFEERIRKKIEKKILTKVAITYLRFAYCLVTNVKSIDYYCAIAYSVLKTIKLFTIYVHSGIFRTHVKIANAFIILFVFCSLLFCYLLVMFSMLLFKNKWYSKQKKNEHIWER